MEQNDIAVWNIHQQFMAKALTLAEIAGEKGEIPVGAIIVKDNMIIGKGYNQVESLKDPTAHAEVLAISAACSTLSSKYLSGCTLYVTLEPCMMCAGALVWSKIGRVVFGASDAKSGSCGSVLNITHHKSFNHKVEVIQGILENDCEYLLKEFFAKKRIK